MNHGPWDVLQNREFNRLELLLFPTKLGKDRVYSFGSKVPRFGDRVSEFVSPLTLPPSDPGPRRGPKNHVRPWVPLFSSDLE